MNKIFNKQNRNTILLLFLFFIYFVIAINYSMMWFTDMGATKLSIVQKIKISFIPLMPYLIAIIIGVLKMFKSEKLNYNYKLFIITFIIIVAYYFYLSSVIPISLLENY